MASAGFAPEDPGYRRVERGLLLVRAMRRTFQRTFGRLGWVGWLAIAPLAGCGYQRGEVLTPGYLTPDAVHHGGVASALGPCAELAVYRVDDDAIPIDLPAFEFRFGNACRTHAELDLRAVTVSDERGEAWLPVDPDGAFARSMPGRLLGGVRGDERLLFVRSDELEAATRCLREAAGEAESARECLGRLTGVARVCVDPTGAIPVAEVEPACWGDARVAGR